MRGLVALSLTALLLAPALAAAQPASLSIDDVRVRGRDEHRVLVSVLDDAGTPVDGLEDGFEVLIDGEPAVALTAVSTLRHYERATLALVVDGELLRGAARSGVENAVREVARLLRPADRLRIVSAGGRTRSIEAGAAGAAALAERLETLADPETPRIYDALHDAVRAASRTSGDAGAVVLLVTRGADGGSSRPLLDVLALARSRSRLTPVLVTVVGDAGAASESERLQRLAVHTAGAFGRVTSTAELASALTAQVGRGRERWLLRFRAPGWDPRAETHRLAVTVAQGGAARRAETTYRTADAVADPWWRSPLPWLLAAVLAAASAALFLLTRRRQRGLLVHDEDADDGVWYELLALPVSLGSAAGNDIVLPEDHVSRNHALLESKGRGQVDLVDLNSENGTFINGERVSRRMLADGDRISLGPEVHLIYEARG